jgi:protein involved in polysaccharide export with SLBB domain
MKQGDIKMKRFFVLGIFGLFSLLFPVSGNCEDLASEKPAESASLYKVGIGDVLEISVLQPDQFTTTVTVAPDGSISFPYIGAVNIKGKGLTEIQNEIQNKLANGYIKYPVVTVYLKESRSRKFLVYGEVMRPGPYVLEDNTTVLRAISIAGGFTKFGSSSRVKVLRQKEESTGYETIKVDLKRIMDGKNENDVLLKPGDMVVVSEGVF